MIIAHLLGIVIILLTVTVVMSSQDLKKVSNHTEPVTQPMTTKILRTTDVSGATTTAKNTTTIAETAITSAALRTLRSTSATTTIKSTTRSTTTFTTPVDLSEKANASEQNNNALNETSKNQTATIERIRVLPTLGTTVIESIIERYGRFSDVPEISAELSGYETTTELTEAETTAMPPVTVLARMSETSIGEDRCQKYNEASIKKKHSLLYRYPKRYRRCRKRLNYLGEFYRV